LKESELVAEAFKAVGAAYAPYSGIKVGACVVTAGGEVFCGSNVENASYGLTVCAERIAIFRAVVAGHRKLRTIAIAATGMKEPLPCGACLQVMAEFGIERVLVADGDGGFAAYGLKELLPRPFTLEG
jgi:cytidine deaminase